MKTDTERFNLQGYLDIENYILVLTASENYEDKIPNSNQLPLLTSKQSLVLKECNKTLALEPGEIMTIGTELNKKTILINTGISQGIIPVYRTANYNIFLFDHSRADSTKKQTLTNIVEAIEKGSSKINKNKPIYFNAQALCNKNNKLCVFDPFHLHTNNDDKKINETVKRKGVKVLIKEVVNQIGILTENNKTIGMYLTNNNPILKVVS